MPEELLLVFVLWSPNAPLLPRIQILHPLVRRPVEAAAIKLQLPHRRPEPLPPGDVRSVAQDVLVEDERPPGLEHFVDERRERPLRVRDGTDGEDGDKRVDLVESSKCRCDERSLFSAIREDQAVSGRLRETSCSGARADLGMHQLVRLEGDVFGDLSRIKV